MGSFYSSCSISHMRLTNKKTSIQLLVPSYSTDLSGHKSMNWIEDSGRLDFKIDKRFRRKIFSFFSFHLFESV